MTTEPTEPMTMPVVRKQTDLWERVRELFADAHEVHSSLAVFGSGEPEDVTPLLDIVARMMDRLRTLGLAAARASKMDCRLEWIETTAVDQVSVVTRGPCDGTPPW